MASRYSKKWYVVRAVSGQEAKIKDYIMSEISRFGYEHLVEDILVPTEKVIQIRNGKKINKERVYFPGYIMVKANLHWRTSPHYQISDQCYWIFGRNQRRRTHSLENTEVNRMLGKVDELR